MRQKRQRFDPWSGRCPGGRHGNWLQYSCLEIPVDRELGGLQSMGRRVRHDQSNLARGHMVQQDTNSNSKTEPLKYCITLMSVTCMMLIPAYYRIPFHDFLQRQNCKDRKYIRLLSMGFSRQEYWSGLPFPSLGDLPNPGIKPTSPVSPAFAGGFFTTEPPRLLLRVKDRNSTQSSLGPRGICWEGCVSHRLAAWAPGVMGTRDYFYLSATPPSGDLLAHCTLASSEHGCQHHISPTKRNCIPYSNSSWKVPTKPSDWSSWGQSTVAKEQSLWCLPSIACGGSGKQMLPPESGMLSRQDINWLLQLLIILWQLIFFSVLQKRLEFYFWLF